MSFGKRKGIRPRIRPALDWPGHREAFRRVFPFRRSWIAIGILLVFDIGFIIPAVLTFSEAAAEWRGIDDLFDLVAAIFLSAWLIGWSIGPLIMTAVLALLLFGREVITTAPGAMRIFIGLPLLGVAADYSVSGMRNLRRESIRGTTGKVARGRTWRGSHLVFDYGAHDVAFGSDVGVHDLTGIEQGILTGSRQSPRRGEARPDEVEGEWDPPAGLAALAGANVGAPPPAAESGAGRPPVKWSSPSTLALILANLVPVAGAVYFDWNLGELMVLYWAESGIIGFWNVCKMVVINRWAAALSGLFFVTHFGAFMSVHFLFIWSLFIKGPRDTSGGDLSEVAQMFASLWPALALLFVSHGISFFRNFMGRQEYAVRSIGDQMTEPYGRIVAMHVVVIIGGAVTLVLGEPTPVLLLLVAGKVWFDVRAHLAQRKSPV